MDKNTFIITLCVENTQELADFVDVLNVLSNIVSIKVKIISLEFLYHDQLFHKRLSENALFDYEVLKIAPVFKSKCPFPYLDAKRKVLTVLKRKKQIIQFSKAGDLFVVGIQSIFQRLLYSKTKSAPFIAFHRAILFNHRGKANRAQKLFYLNARTFAKLAGLDYLVSPKSGIGYTDYYLVVGDINKNYLHLNGIPQDRIHVVGSPTYDSIGKYYSYEAQNSQSKRLKLYYITSAFDWIGDNEGEQWQKEKIREFANMVLKYKDVSLTIRMHPRESVGKYEQLKKEFPSLEIDRYKSTNLFEDLAKYDVICGGFSTVLFEAMLLNKPVICYLTHEEQVRYKYGIEQTKLNCFANVEDIDEVIQNIFLDGNKENMKQFVEEQKEIVRRVIHFDDKELASEKIACFLAEILYKNT